MATKKATTKEKKKLTAQEKLNNFLATKQQKLDEHINTYVSAKDNLDKLYGEDLAIAQDKLSTGIEELDVTHRELQEAADIEQEKLLAELEAQMVEAADKV